jgi:hypothetical protein
LRIPAPNNVAVPDRCDIDWCLKPNNPMLFTQPAINANTNAPYSIHRGSLEIIKILLNEGI